MFSGPSGRRSSVGSVGRVVLQIGDRFAQNEFRLGVAEDERQPVVRVSGVHRQVDSTGLEDTQRGDDQFG